MGQVSAKAVPPEKAGALLNACEQLWKEMKFNLAHPKKYQHLRYLAHTKWERGDFSLWWCFSSVVLLCEVATRRKIVIPALKGVVCIFAVVLAGNVFLSARGECFLWKEGTGNVFCPADPDTPLCVEVEGSSTALVLAYMVESDVGPGVSQAKKRAALFVNAKSEAKQQWGDLIRQGAKKHRSDVVAGASPESEARASAVEGTTEEAGAPEPKETMGLNLRPPNGFSSLVFPWQEGSRMIHRLVVGCKGLSEETRSRWARSVRSWREPWLQILWAYELEDLESIGVEPHARLLFRNASIVMPATEFADWKARAFPIPLIKDLFQLQCLYMFGGWWADMDYFMLPKGPPSTEGEGLAAGDRA